MKRYIIPQTTTIELLVAPSLMHTSFNGSTGSSSLNDDHEIIDEGDVFTRGYSDFNDDAWED